MNFKVEVYCNRLVILCPSIRIVYTSVDLCVSVHLKLAGVVNQAGDRLMYVRPLWPL